MFGRTVEFRWHMTTPYRSSLPVICIGNLTVGGAGKTPTALAIAKRLISEGERPVILSRGYKGLLRGPHQVNTGLDKAADVGDEPLLLAKNVPTIVAKDRVEGAKFIENMDATMIIMDDGFQNPSLEKDASLIVVDAEVAIGNGQILPAGPLRARLPFQLNRTDAVIAIGQSDDQETTLSVLSIAAKKPFFRGTLKPVQDQRPLKGEKVLAYCAIGRPEKFITTLKQLGASIAASHFFPDHHTFSEHEAKALVQRAKEADNLLVTTEKDLARLSGMDGPWKKLAKKSLAVPIELIFREGDEDRIIDLIRGKLPDRTAKKNKKKRKT